MNTEILMILLGGGMLFLMFLYFVPINLWITAIFSGVKIELSELVFMKIRKSPVKEIINSLIACTKAGVRVTRVELEAHALAGGDVTNVARALIKAKQQAIDVTFQELTAIDLSKQNLDKFLELKRNQNAPGYKEKREALADVVVHQLTDGEIDDLERFLSRMKTQ